ncbi:hypothetical protein UlMin_008135 [Ulmus minor]
MALLEQKTYANDEKISTTDESEDHYSGAKAMPFIIGNETFEKLGSVGTANNLLIYLTTVFNMKSITAATIVNIFHGTTNFATLPGAIISDTCLGRYQTLAISSVVSFLGLIALALTAAITKLHPPPCGKMESSVCTGPTPWQMAFLLMGFGLMIIGAGGIRPCSLAFGADQFNPNTESGKKGVNSFFNWYYFTYTFAMMISLTLIVYVQSDVSWAWGLAIPAFLMLFSLVLFFAGSRLYVKAKPDSSPLASVVQVLVVAAKKRRLKLPEQPCLSLFKYNNPTSINTKLPYTDQFRFLDKAAIVEPKDAINPDGSAANPWRLCSIQQVEEVKCLVRLIPIWTSAIIYCVALVQQFTYVVFQALQSDRKFANTNWKIPAATYTIFTMFAISILLPIYDRIAVPALRRFTRKEAGITVLQKMGTGMVLAVVTMVISALVEEKRRALALNNPIEIAPRRGAVSSLSAFWLVPQLTIIGFSEAFTITALIELYYQQFPENMRSISSSFVHIGFGLSSYLNGSLVSIIHHITSGPGRRDWLPEDLNKGRLDYFYYLVAALEVINFGYFLVCAKWFKYKGKATSAIEDEVKHGQSEKPLV